MVVFDQCRGVSGKNKGLKKDLSLQNIIDEGTNNTFMMVQTAKKLSVNTYDYIFEKVSKTFEVPALAKLIREKSSQS